MCMRPTGASKISCSAKGRRPRRRVRPNATANQETDSERVVGQDQYEMNRSDKPATLAAAALLRDLLTDDPKYRQLWMMRARRPGRAALSQAAVAEVIANHLWEAGERPDSEVGLARDLK